MKRLDNFIKDQEVRPLTTWQCNTLCGGTWVDGDLKKGEQKDKEEMLKGKEKIKVDSENLLVPGFQGEDKSPIDPPGQCPHM